MSRELSTPLADRASGTEASYATLPAGENSPQDTQAQPNPFLRWFCPTQRSELHTAVSEKPCPPCIPAPYTIIKWLMLAAWLGTAIYTTSRQSRKGLNDIQNQDDGGALLNLFGINLEGAYITWSCIATTLLLLEHLISWAYNAETLHKTLEDTGFGFSKSAYLAILTPIYLIFVVPFLYLNTQIKSFDQNKTLFENANNTKGYILIPFITLGTLLKLPQIANLYAAATQSLYETISCSSKTTPTIKCPINLWHAFKNTIWFFVVFSTHLPQLLILLANGPEEMDWSKNKSLETQWLDIALSLITLLPAGINETRTHFLHLQEAETLNGLCSSETLLLLGLAVICGITEVSLGILELTRTTESLNRTKNTGAQIGLYALFSWTLISCVLDGVVHAIEYLLHNKKKSLLDLVIGPFRPYLCCPCDARKALKLRRIQASDHTELNDKDLILWLEDIESKSMNQCAHTDDNASRKQIQAFAIAAIELLKNPNNCANQDHLTANFPNVITEPSSQHKKELNALIKQAGKCQILLLSSATFKEKFSTSTYEAV